MNILLVCVGGFSSSMLMEEIIIVAKAKNIDLIINAIGESRTDKCLNGVDIILLGPQLLHLEKKFREKYEPKNIKVITISIIDYGMMNGENVLLKVQKELSCK